MYRRGFSYRVIIIKTLIELFDSCQLENLIAGLMIVPEKIVFVGFKNVMTPEKISSLEKLFNLRGHNIEFVYEIVGRYDFDSIYTKLADITEKNEDCAFDITGGSEIVVAAMGIVSKEKNIPIVQIDIKNGKFIRVKGFETTPEIHPAELTFKETVELNGGCIVEKTSDEFEWVLSDDFKSDLKKMWNICREDCSGWNKKVNMLASMEETDLFNRSLTIKAKKRKEAFDEEFINKLSKEGLILDYYADHDVVTFRYKNESVHRVLIKAGNLLELYMYMLLWEIDEENKSWYDDILTGVVVDWDGIVYKSYTRPADTQNELDLVVMRDSVPVFISCKNGEVHKEAMYELDTVATRFGGKYARKVLISTYMTFNEKGRKHLESRAADMGIVLIHGVNKLTKEELKKLLKEKIQ